MLASKLRGVLYLGVTTNLATRVEQHKSGAVPGFTARHRVNRLVWFQGFDDIRVAIAHEKRLKRWRREWKIKLIEASKPNWDELHPW
ncbi:MAG: GIY-YIG nuclease family protein [Alphaproteobacteria bacterium]